VGLDCRLRRRHDGAKRARHQGREQGELPADGLSAARGGAVRRVLAAASPRPDGANAGFSVAPFVNDSTTWGGISASAALAAYSFLGFDAVTTLTEETVDPRRTMPRAILLIALIGGGIFILVAYTTQLVHPGSFAEPDSAAFSIATTIAGDVFASTFLAGLVVRW
jgi:amino acid transporter